MELIDNQPIIFELPTNNVECDSLNYTQLVDLSDTNQFQVKLEPCTDAENLISNGAFNDSTDWNAINFSIADNQACALGGISAAIYQNNVFTAGNYYKVTVTIDSGTNVNLLVYFGNGNLVQTITGVGTYEIFGFAVNDGGGLGDSLIFTSVEPATVCISNVSVFEVQTNFGIGIKDNNGYIIYQNWLNDYIVPSLTGADITSYVVDSEYFTLNNGVVTVDVKWGDFGIQTPACYTICLLDPCVNTNFNTSFCDSSSWSVADLGGATATFQDNDSDIRECTIYYYDNLGGGFSTVTDLVNSFVPGTKYQLKFTLSTMNESIVYFQLDTADSDLFTTNGTHTTEMVADGSTLKIKFEGVVNAGVSTATISYLSVHVANSLLETTICSEPFKLGTYNGTQLINACNDTDAFGLYFDGTGFSPSIRVESQLDRSQYNFDRATEQNSFARIRTTFFQRTKKKRLIIQPVSEYVHNFLSLLAGFDHFYIDGIEYVIAPDQEYIVSYDGSDFVGSVSIDVILKEQLARNSVTSAEGIGCNTTGDESNLVDEATGLFNLTAEDDSADLVEENS